VSVGFLPLLRSIDHLSHQHHKLQTAVSLTALHCQCAIGHARIIGTSSVSIPLSLLHHHYPCALPYHWVLLQHSPGVYRKLPTTIAMMKCAFIIIVACLATATFAAVPFYDRCDIGERALDTAMCFSLVLTEIRPSSWHVLERQHYLPPVWLRPGW